MNRGFIVAIGVIFIALGITGSCMINVNAVTQSNDANNGAPPAKPSDNGNGPGGSMDNSANVVTTEHMF